MAKKSKRERKHTIGGPTPPKSERNSTIQNSDINATDEVVFHAPGGTLHLQPINLFDMEKSQEALDKQFRESGKPITPPEIKIPVAGGSTSKILTEEMVTAFKQQIESGKMEVGGEMHTAFMDVMPLWEDYVATYNEFLFKKNDITMRYIFDGVIEKLPESNDWIKRRKRRLIDDVPPIAEDGDDFDRYRYWIVNEVLKTASCYVELQTRIMQLSSDGLIGEEDVAAARNTFRDSLHSQLDRQKESNT